MAEFCLECWNKINGTEDGEWKYVLSKSLYLCEGCGELKYIIVTERDANIKFNACAFIMKFLIAILYIIFNLLMVPYFVFRYIKFKNKHN